MSIELYFDGAISENPGGTATWAYIIMKDGQILADDSGLVGKGEGMTVNVAEYGALVKGLLKINERYGDEATDGLEIYGDSKLVINQVAERWRCKSAHLRAFKDKCQELLKGIPADLRHIPREQNTAADRLAVMAMDRFANEMESFVICPNCDFRI